LTLILETEELYKTDPSHTRLNLKNIVCFSFHLSSESVKEDGTRGVASKNLYVERDILRVLYWLAKDRKLKIFV
jgi:hypothetical protein